MSFRHLGRSAVASAAWLKEHPTVRVRDPQNVQMKVQSLIRDGPSKVQLITDFDRTLSRTHYDGKPVSTSYCIFEDDHHVKKEYKTLAVELRKKYYPVEIDPNLTNEQKLPHMIQWYKESFDIVLKLRVHIDDLPAMVKRADLHLREHTVTLFNLLAEQEIPILVFSAGLGDVVRISLYQQGAQRENVTILSNFLEYDQQGWPVKFSDTLLHMYNKTALFPHAGEYYKHEKLRNRKNAVLLGDSIGDCTMVDGAACVKPPPEGDSVVLKVGFLDHDIEERLQTFLVLYDLVLVDDQTMNVAVELSREICQL